MPATVPASLSSRLARLAARIAERERDGLPVDRLRAQLAAAQALAAGTAADVRWPHAVPADAPAVPAVDVTRGAAAGSGGDGTVAVQAAVGHAAETAAAALRRAGRLRSVPAIRYPAELPITGHLEVLRAALRDSRVVIVAGETGSGKTTQLPKLCLELGRGIDGMIGHTQPRRLAARAVAARLAEELGVAGGGIVGHAVRFDDRTAATTLVKVMTDGILLAELGRDPDLRAYDTLIVDEAHERSLNIDFLLGVLHRLLARRADLRVIVTSATLDVARFAAFFGNAPVVEVSGRGYPVEVRYLPPEAGEDGTLPDLEQQVSAAWADALAHERAHGGRPAACDALVFLPGEREIAEVARGLRRRGLDGDPEILPLYARLPASEQARVFAPGARRRIVLSTNVAETSLTVPRIGYVIDSGLVRISRYSLRSKIQQLPVEGVSQASAEQRKGRCGRIGPGTCYRLYAAADLQGRPAYTDAEIVRTNLAAVVLRMKHLGLGDLAAFPLLDPPPPRAIADALQLLLELQAIDAAGLLTAVGRRMAALPVDPRLARMLIAAMRPAAGTPGADVPVTAATGAPAHRTAPGPAGGALPDGAGSGALPDNAGSSELSSAGSKRLQARGVAQVASGRSPAAGGSCLHAVLVIVAALAAADPRERPADQRGAADAAHAAWRHERSDFLSFVRLWNWFEAQRQALSRSQLRTLCRASFLSFQRMWEWRDVHRQLRVALGVHGDAIVGDVDEAALHRALLAGLLSQVGMRGDNGEYRGARGLRFFLASGSALSARRPPWLMAAEIVGLERVSARIAGAIEPQWLEAAAAHLLVRSHDGAHWQAERGRAAIHERATLYGLPVYERRRVALDRIDAAQARLLLLREGLVQGALPRLPQFLRENQALVRTLVELEDRLRRRDLLVSEDAQLAFYDARVPAHVCDLAGLERALRHDAKLAAVLRMSESDVRAHALAAPPEREYPGELQVAGVNLRVVYRFAPGAADDGVCLQVPIGVLPALDAAPLSWLVPGFLPARVEALLRALPRGLRKLLPPMPLLLPPLLDALAADAAQRTRPLAVALADALARLHGVRIPLTAWAEASLPDHLRMNLELVDARGAVIDRGRDLAVLRRAHLLAPDAGGGAWRECHEAVSLTQLPADGIAGQVRVHVDGAERVAFPALVAEAGGNVALRLLDDPRRARQQHAAGVVRLLHARLPASVRDVRRVRGFEQLALKFAPLGGRALLVEQLLQAAIGALLAVDPADIRDEPALVAALASVRERLPLLLATVVADATAVLDARAALRTAMAARPSPAFAASHADVEAQLERLVPADFIARHGCARLPDIARYLRAAGVRIDGLQGHVPRDQQRIGEFAALAARLAALSRRHPDDTRIEELGWAIEDLRVAVFAPRLVAAQQRRPGAASTARLAARIAALEAELGT
jgi:ATP-dependent helicase HrpA